MQARYNYVLGYGAFFIKKYSEALRFFQESVKYDGNWAPAFNDLGRTYVKLKDFYHAEQGYRKAVAADPNWVFPQLNLAGVYLHKKQWNLAEQAYFKVTRIDSTYATPWYFLGEVYEGQNQLARAIGAYQRAVQLGANRPSSVFRLDEVRRRVVRLRRKLGQRPPGPRPALGDRIAGVWVGTGRQVTGVTWSFRLKINKNWKIASRGEVVGTINYLSLSCGGLIIKAEGRFQEKLNYGKDRCIDGGSMNFGIDSDGRRLNWNWYYPNGRWGAKALLARQ